MPLDPGLRSLRARIAAHAKAAAYPRGELTAAARAAFLRSFEEQVDLVHPGLSDEERRRRALSLRKAYFARLAYESAKSRRRAAGSAIEAQPRNTSAQPLRPGRALMEAGHAAANSTG